MNVLRNVVLLLVLLVAVPLGAVAQEELLPEVVVDDIIDPALQAAPQENFYRGEVLEIIEEREESLGTDSMTSLYQRARVRYTSGPLSGEEVEVEYGSLLTAKQLSEGQAVVLVAPDNVGVFIFDQYRLPILAGIFILFMGLAIVFAGWRGASSLLGLVASILVIVFFAVPQIMNGHNPLVISLMTAFVIGVVSIYVAHGFSKRTTVAVVSTLLTVVLAIILAQLFVRWAGLTGAGSEEAFFLQTSPASFINLRGLLLGGIIIGALGVLDDITTAQAAAAEQIWRANPAFTRKELYQRAAAVGKEHITSLVNTLALAYVGASFPALLLFTVYERPWWVVLNSEAIAEELIRTLVGSSALILAVPITTLLASYWLKPGASDQGDTPDVSHSHAH